MLFIELSSLSARIFLGHKVATSIEQQKAMKNVTVSDGQQRN